MAVVGIAARHPEQPSRNAGRDPGLDDDPGIAPHQGLPVHHSQNDVRHGATKTAKLAFLAREAGAVVVPLQ